MSRSQPLLERKASYLIGGACAVGAAYVAYRVLYSQNKSSSARSKRSTYNAFLNCFSAFASCSDTVALLASDLHTFLSSSNDELPSSFKQLSKVVQSPETRGALKSLISTCLQVASGQADEAGRDRPAEVPIADKIIEAVLSERGKSVIGMAIGIATKNAVTAACEAAREASASSQVPTAPSLKDILDLATSEPGEKLMSILITQSLKTSIETYVHTTSGYNYYADALSAISRTEHRDALVYIMSRITGTFCREASVAFQSTQALPAVDLDSVDSDSERQLDLQASVIRPAVVQKSTTSAGPVEWVRQVSALAGETPVRSLALEVVSSVTREATRETMGAIIGRGSSSSGKDGAPLVASLDATRLYVVLALLIVAVIYIMLQKFVVA